MSIFPKKVTPGRTVTFHVRYPGPRDVRNPRQLSPFVSEFRTSVFMPDGTRRALDTWRPMLLPFDDAPEPTSGAEEGPIRKRAPLMFLADHLQGPNRSAHELVHMLHGMRTATHFYSHYTVPDQADTGRYRTLLETFGHGVRAEKWNSFVVEWIEAEEVRPAGTGLAARILNASAEPVTVRVVELLKDRDGGSTAPERTFRSSFITIPSRSDFDLSLGQRRAFLLYADDVQWLPLSSDGEPFVCRNPSLPWMARAGHAEVDVLLEETGDVVYGLSGAARAIWLAADGMSTRSEIAEGDPSTYREMLDAELLIEVPSNANVRPDSNGHSG